MKLLFCEACWDVFKLDYDVRQCKCGKVKGYYQKDGHTAVNNGQGVSMAMDNRFVLQQVAAMRDLQEAPSDNGYDNYYEDTRIPFWVRPNDGYGNPRSVIKEDI